MAFTERLKVIIDVTTGGAKSTLKDFKQSVSEAQGITGKLRAGVGSLRESFTQAAASPMFLASAITAVTGAAIAAATEFSNAAKRAIDLGNATGLSTENASRWIAIADDMGIAAEELTTPLGKIAKSIESPKWAEYGIQTRDASGNVRDANDILLDALDTLAGISNKTERAKVGAELFGKSWASVSPIVGKSRADYEKLLASVQDGEVITEQEAAKAEEWRLAVDNLSDSWRRLRYQLGQEVVDKSSLVNLIADVVQLKEKLDGLFSVESGPKISDWFNPIGFGIDTFKMLGDEIDRLPFVDAEGKAKRAAEAFKTVANIEKVTSINTLRDATKNAASSIDDLSDSSDDGADSAKDLADAEQEAAEATKRHSDEILRLIDLRNELYGIERSAIDRQYELRDAQQSFNDTMSDATSTTQQQFDAVVNLSEKYGELEGASLNSKEGTDRQVESLEMLLGSIDKDSPLYVAVLEYINLLKQIPATVDTKFGISTPSGANFKLGFGNATYPTGTESLTNAPSPLGRALGGPVSKDSVYQVGEGGKPELLTDAQGRTYLIPGTNGVVTPIGGTGSTGSAGGMTFNVTITKPMVSGEQLANELKKYISRNGSAWLS